MFWYVKVVPKYCPHLSVTFCTLGFSEIVLKQYRKLRPTPMPVVVFELTVTVQDRVPALGLRQYRVRLCTFLVVALFLHYT
jgi:hypothetical protein